MPVKAIPLINTIEEKVTFVSHRTNTREKGEDSMIIEKRKVRTY